MRLLKVADDGSLSFTNDLNGDGIPKHAILSHTWGPPDDEVLYQDILDGNADAKAGFQKIKFCADQAKEDGLDHIWVDTCCINKTNFTELSEAINSMFKWYTNAQVCYVWLPDVSIKGRDQGDEADERLNSSMRNSRWFTRGWTLQELIAPHDVIFYSKEWTKIGDKTSLQRLISEITKIPADALQGQPLEQFSITERLSWQDSRQTTKEEDKAYALLGICGVNLPLIYSEGQESAFRRLKDEIETISKGSNRQDFAVPLAVDDVVGVENFVARQKELKEMREKLHSDGSRRTVVIHGLGGIGKTQLMIAYAKQYKDEYSAIFWLNAKDNDSIKASFANIARQISQAQLSTKSLAGLGSASNGDIAVDAVRSWLCLAGNTRWLMLFDNLDSPKIAGNPDEAAVDVRKFLPSAQQGFVAVTTRSSRLDIGHQLNLQKIVDEEGSLKILADFSNRKISLETPSALELTSKLDGLPLALATAGAYLRQSSMDLTEYLQWHGNAWAKLQQASPGLTSYEDRMLYSTWQVSYDQVERINPLAANLLRLWAHFDSQDLWYELLRHRVRRLGERPRWVKKLVKDKLTFEEAVRVLRDHGLVEPHTALIELTESAGYSVHSCVHTWMRTVLHADDDRELATFAMGCVAAHVSSHEGAKYWLVERRLLGHASFTMGDHPERYRSELAWMFHRVTKLYNAAEDFSKSELLFDVVWADIKDTDYNLEFKYLVARGLASACLSQGKSIKAESIARQALKEHEKAFGLDDKSTLDLKTSLAHILSSAGRSKEEEARKMFLEVLRSQEDTLGREHESTLYTARRLGHVCTSLKDFDKAEYYLRRALQGYTSKYGPRLLMALEIMADLAFLYNVKGDVASAEEIQLQVIQSQESALGCDHPETLASYHALGGMLLDMGRLTESEKMLLLALRGYENIYGGACLTAARKSSSLVRRLARVYKKQSRLDEAEQLLLRFLRASDHALGPRHKEIIRTEGFLGDLYCAQGRYEEAEQMLLKSLEGYEALYGPDHYETLHGPVKDLARLYEKQKRVEKAEGMRLRAVRGLDRSLGPDHEDTIDAKYVLGIFYQCQGKPELAEQLYLQIMSGAQSARDPDRIKTRSEAAQDLCDIYIEQERCDEAEEMLSVALEGYKAIPGPDAMGTLGYLFIGLGELYAMQRQDQKAETMFLQVVRSFESSQNQHSEQARVTRKLGYMYLQQERWREAEDMWSRVLKNCEATHGPDYYWTIMEPVRKLAYLYDIQGRLKEAEAMYLRVVRGLEPWHNQDGQQARARATNNLGSMYRQQKRLKDSEKMLLRALSNYEAGYGRDDIETLSYPVLNLGGLYAEQERVEEAEKMYHRALPAKNELSAGRRGKLEWVGTEVERLRREQTPQGSSLTTSTQRPSNEDAAAQKALTEDDVVDVQNPSSNGHLIGAESPDEDVGDDEDLAGTSRQRTNERRRLYQLQGKWLVSHGSATPSTQVALNTGHSADLPGDVAQATWSTSTAQAEIVRSPEDKGEAARGLLLSLRPRDKR